MTHRKFVLASLILLPLGLGLAGVAVAGSPQLAIPHGVLKVAENGQNNGKDAETQDGVQDEGKVESNDGAQDEGTVESNDGTQDEGNVESGNDGPDKGGANSEHENQGEENGEN